VAKTGILIIVVLAGVVGYLVYHQNELEQRLDVQQKEAEKPKFEHHRDVLAFGEMIVPDNQPRVFPVVADTLMRDTTITGRFTSQGGTDNVIEAFVFDQDNYVNWLNNTPSQALYQSGQVAVGMINLPLRQSGKYYLVFSSKRNFVGRRLNADLKLDYEKRIN